MVSVSVLLQNNSLVCGSLELSVGLPVVNFQMRIWLSLPSRYVGITFYLLSGCRQIVLKHVVFENRIFINIGSHCIKI